MRPIRSRFTAPLFALTLLGVALNVAAGGIQQAAADPYRSGPGLALRGGATLAPPRILDLGSDPVALRQVVG
ncbi:hypothetical protein [Streptomyces sp. NPDC051572]|uniref:hypothetical protein n=1 Tax=Streptomyces sp. NPDC051572 TaxID=3155802 RepID=UPI00345097D3